MRIVSVDNPSTAALWFMLMNKAAKSSGTVQMKTAATEWRL
jgi:hypothetical protein